MHRLYHKEAAYQIWKPQALYSGFISSTSNRRIELYSVSVSWTHFYSCIAGRPEYSCRDRMYLNIRVAVKIEAFLKNPKNQPKLKILKSKKYSLRSYHKEAAYQIWKPQALQLPRYDVPQKTHYEKLSVFEKSEKPTKN